MVRGKLISHHQAVNEVDSCLLMRRAGWKPVALTKDISSFGTRAVARDIKLGGASSKFADWWAWLFTIIQNCSSAG